MATWKKVVVSGSNISQLNNDAGYLTSVIQQSTFVTASYDGTALIADSAQGNLTFASSSGQGLTITANPLNDTLTFGLSAIPNSSLLNSSITIAGNATALGSSVTQAQILAGSTAISASVLSSPGQGQALLTNNGVAGSTIDLGLETTDSPTFVDLTLTGGDLNATTSTTFNLINANQTTVNFAGAATTLNMGNASGTTTIAGNAIVQGDFTVNGTTTYVNVQDIYVEDKFILLASGSANASDGGIIIDRGADAAGNIAYGYDSVTDRWGFQDGLTDSTNTFDPTSASGVSGSFVPYLFVEDNHGATKPTTGEFAVAGAMYVSTAGDFWIYA